MTRGRILGLAVAALALALPPPAMGQSAGDVNYTDPCAGGACEPGGGGGSRGGGSSGSGGGSSGSGNAPSASASAQPVSPPAVEVAATESAKASASSEAASGTPAGELARTGLPAGLLAGLGAMLFAAGAALQRFASISEPRGPRLPEQGSVPTGTFYRDLLDGIGRSGPRG